MKNEKIKKIIKEYLPYVLIIIAVLLIKRFIISPVNVVGDSMYPTLHDGYVMLLDEIYYKFDKLERFDIVVVKYKDASGKSEYIIKRVIGLPGETINYENGKLYVNGKYVKEKFSHEGTKDFEAVTLGDDKYFVMGDNRKISLDSRYIGPIDKDDIRGRTIISIYPFSKFGKSNY